MTVLGCLRHSLRTAISGRSINFKPYRSHVQKELNFSPLNLKCPEVDLALPEKLFLSHEPEKETELFDVLSLSGHKIENDVKSLTFL